MWGFAPVLRRLGQDLGIINVIIGTCVALYVGTLLASESPFGGGGGAMSLFSPDIAALFLFGASGARPVFGYGRWWTVLSAGWLHGGLLHIFLNMYSLRLLGPPTAELYGPGRTVIIYTIGGAAGFLLSSLAGEFMGWMPISFLRGASITIGASAPLFGLIGGLFYYGTATGNSRIKSYITSNAAIWILWGVFMPGIDNYAHAGGFVGGYLAARVLNPHTRERVDHLVIALVCLVLSASAIVVSFITALPLLRR